MAWNLKVVLAVVAVAAGIVWWFHPILDQHEGTAAWVQATGAILIIGATAWIANRSSREVQEREHRTRLQLRESVAVLSRNCLGAIDTLLKNHSQATQSDPRENFLRSYAPSDFEVPMDGLAAVPLHQIDEVALITAVLTLRGVMGRMKKQLDDVLRDPVLSQTLETVHNQRTPAFNAVASILRHVEGIAAENEISRLASRS